MSKALRHGGAMLTVGTLASGVLAYAFNVLAARTLGPEDYGPIAVLWAGLFLVSVVLFRPMEQTLSRGIADRVARDEDARPVIASVVRLATIVALLALAAIAAAWSPITDRLFAGHDVLTASLAVGIAGYAASFVVRGVVSGVHWFHGYGALLLADGGVRVLLALPLVFVASEAIGAGAIALAAVGGAVAPLLMRSGGRRRIVKRLGAPSSSPKPFALGHAMRFAGPAGITAAADQVLVSGGALLVAISGEPGAAAAAGTVFAATMLVRAPVFLFQGCAAALLPSLTAFRAIGDDGAFRRRVVRASAVLSGFAALLCVGTLIAGPEAMRVLYGAGFEVGRLDLTLLAVGIGAYLVAATCSQAALACDMAGRAAAIWAASATLFVALELVVPGDPFHTVCVAFTSAALLNAVLFLALVMRPRASAAGGAATPPAPVAPMPRLRSQQDAA